jgi:predicted MFS family arabinose efflux permease
VGEDHGVSTSASASAPTSAVARAREVLRTRDFRFLFGGRVCSQFADGLFQAVIVASVIFSPDKQDTAAGFAKATAVLVVPYSVIGPFAGVFVDRWRRELILRWTPVARAAAVLLLLGGEHAAVPFYAGALLVLSMNRFFLVTAGTVTPKVVPRDDLLVANSLNSVGGTVSTILGVAIGGWIADAAGFRVLIAACVVLWLVTSVIVRAIRTELSADRAAGRLLHALGAVAREFAAGAGVLWRTPRALAPITSYAFDQFLQGLVLVMSFVVFKERFDQGVGSYSQLIAAGAVGGFLGLGTVGWLDRRLSRPHMVALAFVVSGLPLLLISPWITGWSVLVASFFLGLGFAWKKVPIDTMVQTAVADRYRGRVFAVYDVAQNMARVIAALLAIAVVDEPHAGVTVAVVGAAFVLYAPVLPFWLRRASSLEVRTYSGGRADEQVRAVVVGGEESAVTVEKTWHAERGGERRLCFRVRLDDGTRLEISRAETSDEDDGWRLDRELAAATSVVRPARASEADG